MTLNDISLAGKTALVTGASRGIGRAIARHLGARGALVAVGYSSNRDAALAVVGEIIADGGSAIALGQRLGEPDDAERLLALFDSEMERIGAEPTLDILVNNAGTVAETSLHDSTREHFDTMFGVNVKAPLFIIQQAVSRMPVGGRIVNISSSVVRANWPATLIYTMSKAALESMTRWTAAELAPRGISVNAVAAGNTATEVISALPDTVKTALGATSLFGRIGTVDEIASAVGYLVSEHAGWITGETLEASGGTSLTWTTGTTHSG